MQKEYRETISKRRTGAEQRERHGWYDPKRVSIAVLSSGAGATGQDILIIPFFERDTLQRVMRKRSKASVAPVL